MGDDTERVQALLDKQLPGVDEATREYLAALIAEEEGGPTRSLREEVVPFLLSAGIDGVDDDEDAGNALCDSLEELLKAEFGGKSIAKPSADKENGGYGGATLLNAPVNLMEATAPAAQMGWDNPYGTASNKKSTHNETWETKDLGKAKKERKALRQLQRKCMEEDEGPRLTQLTRMILPTYESAGANRDIQVDKVTIRSPTGAMLIEDAKLKLTYGRRYGVIGKNGCGKTTLLKAMAAQEIEGFPTHLRVLHVSQECGSSEMKVVDAVLAADVELQLLLASEKEIVEAGETEQAGKEGEEVEDSASRLAEIHARLEEIDARTADSRARNLLAGLQFTPEMQAMPLSSMSGGWRVRAAIAAALFIKPEVLMLDEPTNHLDLEAVLWLQNHLQTYPHTVLVVSHDRAFLNEITTDILHVENKQLKHFKGDYDIFEKTRKAFLENQLKEYEKYKADRAHMQEFVDSFRYNAKRASLVQSRIKAIEKLDAEAPPEPLDAIPFTFDIPSPDASPGMAIVQFDQVSFTYPTRNEDEKQRQIFSGVDFNIDGGEKIGIVGPNGAGKSTLLKLALGEIQATSGSFRKKPGTRVASFTQHHADKLDLSLSPLENLLELFPGTLEAAARSWIGGYGISGDMQTTPCIRMSGGQKSRVSFAMLAFAKPSLIVMDEPTNHLDLETIDALLEAVKKFTGGVIVVSHDQHFVENVCSQLWLCGSGKVKKIPGHFAQYKKDIIKSLAK